MSPIYLGNTQITAGRLMLGGSNVAYAYLGNVQVFPLASPDAPPGNQVTDRRAMVDKVPRFQTYLEITNPVMEVEII